MGERGGGFHVGTYRLGRFDGDLARVDECVVEKGNGLLGLLFGAETDKGKAARLAIPAQCERTIRAVRQSYGVFMSLTSVISPF